ncbi:MAG: cyclic nucleotide-binding domain-containing protein [Deltaproteobacteria bacterium]|nr:cyclic nucleotide-binding domain-containing protein [Deltaproteobacteria bacterium]
MKDLTYYKDQAARAMIRGDWAASLAQLELAREIAPKDTYVAMKIGDMHQRLGKRLEAIDAYKRAAALFAAAGFLIKAISVDKLILSLDPDDNQVREALASLYAAQRGEAGFDQEPPPVEPRAAAPEAGSEAPEEAPEEAPDEEDWSIDVTLARIDPNRLPRTPLLSDLNRDEVRELIDKLVPVNAAAGTVICREGEEADSMFIIVHGLVRISSRDTDGSPLWLTNLTEGAFFGEFGVLGDGVRHADVVAAEDTEMLRIDKSQLAALVERHPRVKEVVFRFYKDRVVDTLLAKNPLFRGLTPSQRAVLLEHAALEIHAEDSMIIQEGDDGEHLFILKSGEVEVFTSIGGKRVDLALLQAGDIFGEISVLTSSPTTANVVARRRTELVKFSKREVMEFARAYPHLTHMLSETKDHRIAETVRRIQTEGFV